MRFINNETVGKISIIQLNIDGKYTVMKTVRKLYLSVRRVKQLQRVFRDHGIKFGDEKHYALHGFIDDATWQIIAPYFCINKCFMEYLKNFMVNIQKYGILLEI